MIYMQPTKLSSSIILGFKPDINKKKMLGGGRRLWQGLAPSCLGPALGTNLEI